MSVIAVTFNYSMKTAISDMSDETYQQLREEFPELELNEDKAVEPRYWQEIHVDEQDFYKLVEYGLKPTAERIKGLIHDRLPSQIDQVFEPRVGPTYVNLSVPNASLFQVTSVDVIEDACTNDLQQHLNDGWRIIAVCPPNDCRRPTYILGHFEEGRSLT